VMSLDLILPFTSVLACSRSLFSISVITSR
jgi:hypothetical protein